MLLVITVYNWNPVLLKLVLWGNRALLFDQLHATFKETKKYCLILTVKIISKIKSKLVAGLGELWGWMVWCLLSSRFIQKHIRKWLNSHARCSVIKRQFTDLFPYTLESDQSNLQVLILLSTLNKLL